MSMMPVTTYKKKAVTLHGLRTIAYATPPIAARVPITKIKDTILAMAKIVSFIFVMGTLAAIGGVAYAIVLNPWSVTAFFLYVVTGIMLMTAFLRLQPMMLLYGLAYLFTMIPSQVVLIIFVVINADVLDWGTREGAGTADAPFKS